MIKIAFYKRIFSAVCLVALSAFHAHAAPTLTVAGEGTAYTVIGSGLTDIVGIDLTLNYDSSSLSSPTVSQGNLVSGAILMPNTTTSGTIRLIIMQIPPKSINGSGQIVTINFASRNGSGGITSCLITSVIDSDSKVVPATCTVAGGSPAASASGSTFTLPITASPIGGNTDSGTGTTTGNVTVSGGTTSSGGASPAPAPTATPSGSPVNLGTLPPPVESQPKHDPLPVEPPATPVQHAEPPIHVADEPPLEEKPVAVPQKPREVKMISLTSTLESFRSYRGEKSPAILVALMTRDVTPTIRQEPAVALSDGKTTLKIVVKLASADEESPNFALNGATMVTLGKGDAAATWVIEALPQTSTLQSTLTILTAGEIIDFPLTVAPPAAGVTPSEGDFAVFLKDSGAVPSKRDLNGDGRHDYLDDFIYTANYLSQKGAAGSPKTR